MTDHNSHSIFHRLMVLLASIGNGLALLILLLSLLLWSGIGGLAGGYLTLWLLVPLMFVLLVAGFCGWGAFIAAQLRGRNHRPTSPWLSARRAIWLAMPGTLLFLAWALHLGPLLKMIGQMVWNLVRVTLLQQG